MSKLLSTMTMDMRFDCGWNYELKEMQTDLVPFPRIHFMTTSFVPIASTCTLNTTNNLDVIIDDCLKSSSFLVKIPDWDVYEDKYLANRMIFLGDVKSKEVNRNIQNVKSMGKLHFVT
eukprot:UN18258